MQLCVLLFLKYFLQVLPNNLSSLISSWVFSETGIKYRSLFVTINIFKELLDYWKRMFFALLKSPNLVGFIVVVFTISHSVILYFFFLFGKDHSVFCWTLSMTEQEVTRSHLYTQSFSNPSTVTLTWCGNDQNLSYALLYCLSLLQALPLTLTSMQVGTVGPIPEIWDEFLLAFKKDFFFVEAKVRNSRWCDQTAHIKGNIPHGDRRIFNWFCFMY